MALRLISSGRNAGPHVSTAAAAAAVVHRLPRCCPFAVPFSSGFSTRSRKHSYDPEDSIPPEPEIKKQPFVNMRIDGGEWDPQRTNPLYRPKFKSEARIISADDFARRPKVGMSTEFETFADAMVTLSWLDESEQKQIYNVYVSLMNAAVAKGKTSHEYVMRVLAQKFNVTAERIAAVVQLQHNEAELLRNRPEIHCHLLYEEAKYMDKAIKQEIENAYKSTGEVRPNTFVEDPVGVDGLQETKKFKPAEDLLDVGDMYAQHIVREEARASLLIDGHEYVEDMDKDKIIAPMNQDCKRLLKQHNKFNEETDPIVLRQREKKKAAEPVNSYRPKNSHGYTRPRWKYVAQIVNTRENRRNNKLSTSYVNNDPENTLVEHNGTLRPGTMKDIESMSWKPVRNQLEHTYAGAKEGWLDKIYRGDDKAWGPAPPQPAKAIAQITAASDEAAAEASSDDPTSPVDPNATNAAEGALPPQNETTDSASVDEGKTSSPTDRASFDAEPSEGKYTKE
jgi:hypothetical protein